MLAFPFDSRVEVVENPITHELETQFDRAVSSQPMRHLMRKLFTTGIMPDLSDNYLVSAGSDGMTVVVHSGFAVVDGGLALETENRTLEVTAADTTLDRIDTVVLRWNENVDVRTADLYVVSGTPAANPVRPELQRGESIYEIGLADIFITRSVATITNEKITDARYEAERCGVVRSISEYDTTYIYQQVQADLASFKANEQAEFVAWFESIKDILDENVAVHLQSEIDDINESLSDKANVSLLTAEDDLKFQFSKSGSNYGYKDANGNFVPFKNPTGTKSITANGTYNVTDYASVYVNVSNLIYLGTNTSYNIKNLYPNLYSRLSASDFIVETQGGSADHGSVGGGAGAAYFTFGKSYDSSTGVLSITAQYGFNIWNNYYTYNAPVKVYLKVPTT